MFTALARGGLRLLAAAGGDNFYLRSLGQAVNPVGDHAISGGKPGADDYFLAVWMPGVTLCLLTLFSSFSTHTKCPSLPICSAAAGITTAFCWVSTSRRALTN